MTHLPVLQETSDETPPEKETSQLTLRQKGLLKKQGYRLVGNHSAVKTCEWTRKMIRGQGGCYKYVFYGIRSHQCMQMTTSMFCASRCKFCWRGEKAPVAKLTLLMLKFVLISIYLVIASPVKTITRCAFIDSSRW